MSLLECQKVVKGLKEIKSLSDLWKKKGASKQPKV